MERSTITTVMLVMTLGAVAFTILVTFLLPEWRRKRLEPYWTGGMIGIVISVGSCVPNFYNILESDWIRQHPGTFWPIYICSELLRFLLPICVVAAASLKNWRWHMTAGVVLALYLLLFFLLFRS